MIILGDRHHDAVSLLILRRLQWCAGPTQLLLEPIDESDWRLREVAGASLLYIGVC
jgi:hypothetical protein